MNWVEWVQWDEWVPCVELDELLSQKIKITKTLKLQWLIAW